MPQLLVDYYRCPEEYDNFAWTGNFSRAGNGSTCSHDAIQDTLLTGLVPALSSDPAQLIDDLRFERYVSNGRWNRRNFVNWKTIKPVYYRLRPLLPSAIRRKAQRMYFGDWRKISFPAWPVDRTVDRIFEKLLVQSLKTWSVDRIPFIWFWPDGAQSCAIMTHDVEAKPGRDFCSKLMDLDDLVGLKASFQIVPEDRYDVSEEFLETIRQRGFEINIQDLNHDGCLFDDRDQFFGRAERINLYGKKYGARGFRSAVLYREMDWYGALDFAYDMSVPSVAHLEPQRGGCCTLMPFFIGEILELPLTTIQDCSLFYVLKDYSTSVWKKQASLIAEKHGLANFLVHPDYLLEKRAQDTYKELLECLAHLRDDRKVWIALPGDVETWWRRRSRMRLVPHKDSWGIEGVGKERARIAYASLEDDEIVYTS